MRERLTLPLVKLMLGRFYSSIVSPEIKLSLQRLKNVVAFLYVSSGRDCIGSLSQLSLNNSLFISLLPVSHTTYGSIMTVISFTTFL